MFWEVHRTGWRSWYLMTGAGHQELEELRRNWRNCAGTGGTAQELENCRNWRNFPSKSPPNLVAIPCM